MNQKKIKSRIKEIGQYTIIDKVTVSLNFVALDGMGKPGHIYTIGHVDSGMIGVHKLENQVV